MKSSKTYDAEALTISGLLGDGPRIVVIGSTSFWGADSEALTQAIARQLARLAGLTAMAGGMDGVGATFGLAFATARQELGQPEQMFHLLPRGMWGCDHGVTLHGGDHLCDRREILGRVSKLVLAIEGGPGTAHEATVARDHGAVVIPLARSGGESVAMFAWQKKPASVAEADWAVLNDQTATIADVAVAVARMVAVLAGIRD